MTKGERPYILAVSGGIDSMVLLDMMRSQNAPVIVAHVDHGIRPDGEKDREIVENYARAHNLSFVTTQLKLGPGTDEMTARTARYEWLRRLRDTHDAQAIMTAHHVDDLIETIAINITRGTGWRGLCSMRATGEIRRPLLGIGMRKADVVRYAIEHNLTWREDETNDDVRYTRNYLRHGRLSQLSQETIIKLLDLYNDQCRLRVEINEELYGVVNPANPLRRHLIIMTPQDVAEELVQAWLGHPEERPILRRIVHFAKTAQPGAKLSYRTAGFIEATGDSLFVSRL